MTFQLSRRLLLAGSVIAAATPFAKRASAKTASQNYHKRDVGVEPKIADHAYEVNYTEAEWKSLLSEEEFRIMRLSGTEYKKSSPLWNETRTGIYKCKGCDLPVYDSEYKVHLKKGWLFFQHSEPDSVLTGIDLYTNYGRSKSKRTAIEAHCRRCGSHFGHVLYVKKQILHCINGAALTFE